MDEKFVEIINEMAEVLNAAQLKRLQEVMLKHLVEREPRKRKISNREYLTKFLEAKRWKVVLTEQLNITKLPLNSC